MFPLHLYWLCFLYFFQSKLIKSDFHLVLFQPTRLSIIFWKQIFTEGSSGSLLFVHSANSSINPDNFLLLIFIVFAKRKMSHYINIRPINFNQTSVKLLEKIGIYYQLTNPWKKNSKRTSYRFQTKQKYEGTHRQQQKQKQHCKQIKQNHFETRKMLPEFWK